MRNSLSRLPLILLAAIIPICSHAENVSSVTSFIDAFHRDVLVDSSSKTIASKNCYIEVHALTATELYLRILAPWKDLTFSISANSSSEITTILQPSQAKVSVYDQTDCESQGCSGPYELTSSLEISKKKLVATSSYGTTEQIECEL